MLKCSVCGRFHCNGEAKEGPIKNEPYTGNGNPEKTLNFLPVYGIEWKNICYSCEKAEDLGIDLNRIVYLER